MIQWDINGIYHLVTNITMENHSFFNGKINYKLPFCNSYVGLPEGINDINHNIP